MKDIKDLTEKEIILEIFKCDKHIQESLAVEIDHYPGAIMGLGDFYIEKHLLIDELLRRKHINMTSKEDNKVPIHCICLGRFDMSSPLHTSECPWYKI